MRESPRGSPRPGRWSVNQRRRPQLRGSRRSRRSPLPAVKRLRFKATCPSRRMLCGCSPRSRRHSAPRHTREQSPGSHQYLPLEDRPRKNSTGSSTRTYLVRFTTREAVKHFWAEGRKRHQHRVGTTRRTRRTIRCTQGSKGAGRDHARTSKELATAKDSGESVPGCPSAKAPFRRAVRGRSEFEKQLLAAPLGRVGQPSDIALIAVLFASDESGWLTGEVILASGGLRK